jgi:predicted membrane-bound dolichyl-phosphate-mannose-protein mannosyltransferase
MKAWLRDNKIAGRLPGWIAKSLMILLTGIVSRRLVGGVVQPADVPDPGGNFLDVDPGVA